MIDGNLIVDEADAFFVGKLKQHKQLLKKAHIKRDSPVIPDTNSQLHSFIHSFINVYL